MSPRAGSSPEFDRPNTFAQLVEGYTALRGIVENYSETCDKRLERLEQLIGDVAKPGKFATDTIHPGSGIAGAVEQLANQQALRTKASTGAAARTGALTSAIIVIVLEIARLLVATHEKGADAAPPPMHHELAP